MTSLTFDLHEKVAALQAALLEQHPRMPTLLQEIHKQLRTDPDNVTALSEEEIATIVGALKVQTKVEIAATMVKSKTGKSLKSLSVMDL